LRWGPRRGKKKRRNRKGGGGIKSQDLASEKKGDLLTTAMHRDAAVFLGRDLFRCKQKKFTKRHLSSEM